MQKITEDHSLTADLLHILINMTYFSANTSITLIEHKAISKINKVFDKHPNDCAQLLSNLLSDSHETAPDSLGRKLVLVDDL